MVFIAYWGLRISRLTRDLLWHLLTCTYSKINGEPVWASWSQFSVRILSGVSPGRMTIFLWACVCNWWVSGASQFSLGTGAQSHCRWALLQDHCIQVRDHDIISWPSHHFMPSRTPVCRNTVEYRLREHWIWKGPMFIYQACWTRASELPGILIHCTHDKNEAQRNTVTFLRSHSWFATEAAYTMVSWELYSVLYMSRSVFISILPFGLLNPSPPKNTELFVFMLGGKAVFI